MKVRILLLFAMVAIEVSCFSQITITFNIDMSGQTIELGGVHIAGQFGTNSAISITQDWQPGAAGSQLTNVSGSVYTLQVTFPSSAAGKKLEFQFVRANIWFGSEDFSEGNPGDVNAHLDNSCGVPDGTGGYNRIITIPMCDGVFNAVWNYCGSLTASPPPSLSVSSNSTICPGQSVQLSASSNGTLIWTPSIELTCSACNNPIASPGVSTLYTVRASISSCSIIDSIFVTVDNSLVNAGTDRSITEGSNTQLNATGVSSYMWEPSYGLSCTNCSSPMTTPVVTTTYIVYGTSVNGCNSSDTVVVYVSKSPCKNIYLPTVFTPNNDNVNDQFGPLVLNSPLPEIDVFKIYNRWGELIFETKNLYHKWDGKFHGVMQSTGSYVYYVQLDCNGKTVLIKGIVTLLR